LCPQICLASEEPLPTKAGASSVGAPSLVLIVSNSCHCGASADNAVVPVFGPSFSFDSSISCLWTAAPSFKAPSLANHEAVMSHQPSPYRQISAECRYLVKTFTLSVFHPASFFQRVLPSADHWPSSLLCLHSARYHSCLPSRIVGLGRALTNNSAASSLLSSSRVTLLASRPSMATALQGFVRLQLARSQGYLPFRLPFYSEHQSAHRGSRRFARLPSVCRPMVRSSVPNQPNWQQACLPGSI